MNLHFIHMLESVAIHPEIAEIIIASIYTPGLFFWLHIQTSEIKTLLMRWGWIEPITSEPGITGKIPFRAARPPQRLQPLGVKPPKGTVATAQRRARNRKI